MSVLKKDKGGSRGRNSDKGGGSKSRRFGRGFRSSIGRRSAGRIGARTTKNVLHGSTVSGTVNHVGKGLRSVPHHDTTKAGVILNTGNNVLDSVRSSVTRTSGRRRTRETKVNLDIRVS